MFFRLAFGVFIGIALATSAHANAQTVEACRAMAATIAPRQAEVDALVVLRDETAAWVEAQGDVWEDAETHRLISTRHAAAANAARASYDDARKALARQEMALQATVRSFNYDLERFNRICATED